MIKLSLSYFLGQAQKRLVSWRNSDKYYRRLKTKVGGIGDGVVNHYKCNQYYVSIAFLKDNLEEVRIKFWNSSEGLGRQK